jgi:GNAT superfamily N-acetyltransferase
VVDEAPPVIYFDAITLGETPESSALPERAADLVAALEPLEGRLDVCDSWSALDLAAYGLIRESSQEWMVREPSPLEPVSISGVEIVSVADDSLLDEFEATHNEGFESTGTPPRTFYGPSVLRDRRMHMLLARVESGTAVGSAMAYETDEAVGVFSVAVIPSMRRRGIGAALTGAAVLCAPNRPAVLQPSSEGRSMYLRMGFEPLAEFAVWSRPRPASP